MSSFFSLCLEPGKNLTAQGPAKCPVFEKWPPSQSWNLSLFWAPTEIPNCMYCKMLHCGVLLVCLSPLSPSKCQSFEDQHSYPSPLVYPEAPWGLCVVQRYFSNSGVCQNLLRGLVLTDCGPHPQRVLLRGLVGERGPKNVHLYLPQGATIAALGHSQSQYSRLFMD